MMNYGRYRRNPVVDYPEREWPGKEIEKAPVWCSVDLRDGNQALIDPMVVHEKIEMFQYLIKLGFREIEIGFPAASQIEYDFLRQLVDRKMIPQDVWVQVLTQCREEQIERTFESIAGCSQAIVHIYNSTSTLQRDVVFGMDREEIINIAVQGTKWVKERAEKFPGKFHRNGTGFCVGDMYSSTGDLGSHKGKSDYYQSSFYSGDDDAQCICGSDRVDEYSF